MNTTDMSVPPVRAADGAPDRWPALARLRGAAARGLCAAVAAGALATMAMAAPAGAATAATSAPAGTWSELSPATSPPADGGSMAYDRATGQTILFTYAKGPGLASTAETWNWTGTTWTQLDPATSPAARFGASIAYDPALGGLVLFGGESYNGTSYVFDADTWLWNGTTWTQLDPATRPAARYSASLAYDSATSQLILFGGEGGNPTIGANGITGLNDTWTFNGTTWTQLKPTASPSARYDASLAYDSATSQLILFGGISADGSTFYGDTWNWTGTTWTQLKPTASPAARYSASLAYDSATSQLILFGGGNDANGIGDDTWAWTGTTWTQLDPASPPATYGGAMAYDASTGLLVLVGAGDGANTWAYGAPSAPAITSGSTATFTQGSPGTFTVTATGLPAPTFTETGALPAGLSFSSSGALSGTPDGVSGAFDLTITATNSSGTATQDLVLVVDEAPVITSLKSATFVAGFKGKFQVTAAGYPAPAFAETGTLPAGVTLSSTGLLSGAPAAGTQGSYPIVITATNLAGTGKQKFTLTVDQ